MYKTYDYIQIKPGLYHGTVYISVKVDEENRILHILDMDQPACMSLTNAVSELFMKKVRYSLKENTIGFRVWLYGSDGLISEYQDGHFHFIDDNHSEIPKEFLHEIKAMKLAY